MKTMVKQHKLNKNSEKSEKASEPVGKFAGMGEPGSKEEKKMLAVELKFLDGGGKVKWSEADREQVRKVVSKMLVALNRKFIPKNYVRKGE